MQRLDAEIDAGERLDEAVVQVAGDARALFEHGDFLGLRLQARRLEAGGGLADEQEQELEIVARELAARARATTRARPRSSRWIRTGATRSGLAAPSPGSARSGGTPVRCDRAAEDVVAERAAPLAAAGRWRGSPRSPLANGKREGIVAR